MARLRIRRQNMIVRLCLSGASNMKVILRQSKIKSSLQSRYYTQTCVTSGGAHLRGLAPGQRSSEETSQQRRAVDNSGSEITGPGIEPKTSRADSNVGNHKATERYYIGRNNLKYTT